MKALYSMIQFCTILILYFRVTNISDWEYLYIDLIIINLVALTMSLNEPSDRISRHSPPRVLMAGKSTDNKGPNYEKRRKLKEYDALMKISYCKIIPMIIIMTTFLCELLNSCIVFVYDLCYNKYTFYSFPFYARILTYRHLH